jgi:hypothetical protein
MAAAMSVAFRQSLFDSGEDEYGAMLPAMKGASNPVIARHQDRRARLRFQASPALP